MRNPVTKHPTRYIVAAACALILSGCASQKSLPTTQFDFGPATPAQAQPQTQTQTPGATGPVIVTDVTGSSALDSERMFYRLSYADPLQARTYANSRWTASPLQLLTQRFKTRLAQSGARVLSETDAASGIPLLRIDVDDFVQDFGGVSQSTGVVAVRASVFQGHVLVDQRSFRQAVAATSADAAGGARALAASTDAVAADIVAWLGTLGTLNSRTSTSTSAQR
jgi:cholesterol transport system auxiliary component